MKPRVVVGLSGGVDSSVAAHLLIEQGYDVVGVYMKNWDDPTGRLHGDCPFEEDSQFAAMVAKRLGIPFEIVDLSQEYRARVIDYLFREYERGRTPNPDVLCNREIKFDAFWRCAKQLGAEYVATGHYAQRRVENHDGKPRYRLLAGLDETKDQSYFLCQLTQEQLSRALFPIGDMRKQRVRELARELGLATAARKDSYGICFVGKIDLPTFLSQRLAPREGSIIELPPMLEPPSTDGSLRARAKPYPLFPEMGQEVGQHHGAHFFTIGQRKGLGVGGKEKPLFVVATDTVKNILYVAQGHEHAYLNRDVAFVPAAEAHWIDSETALPIGSSRPVAARLRHRQPLQSAKLHAASEGLYLEFDRPQRGITAGQFAVWYDGNELLGSGPVEA